jgi:hypothetical protein
MNFGKALLLLDMANSLVIPNIISLLMLLRDCEACRNSRQGLEAHFTHMGEMVNIGSGSQPANHFAHVRKMVSIGSGVACEQIRNVVADHIAQTRNMICNRLIGASVA